MSLSGKISALSAAIILPGMAAAGSYGEVGVKDARVVPAATATATVWCPAIKAEIPVTLQAEMDCAGAVPVGTAKPKVARERFTSSPTTTGRDDDRPRRRTIVTNDPAPKNNGPIDKWGRLGQLGVNQSNYHQQGQGFIDKVDAYRNKAGVNGDWSNFNPNG